MRSVCGSVGGARVQLRPNARFEVYWGHALKDVDYGREDWNLQDGGIHFAFTASFP